MVVGVFDLQRLDDVVVGRNRLGDDEGPLLVLVVELLTLIPDDARGADQRRQQDDRALKYEDLIRER